METEAGGKIKGEGKGKRGVEEEERKGKEEGGKRAVK